MQFQNNVNPVSGNGSSRKKLLVICALIGIGLLLLAVLLIQQKENSKSPEGTGQHYDSGSGETVSDPEGKSPETYNVEGPQIVYLGFSNILDRGASRNHIDIAKKAFELYAEEAKINITEVSVFKDTIRHGAFDINTGTRQILFDALVNREDRYNVTMSYSGIVEAKIDISKDGKLVHTSGVVESNPEGYTGDGVPPEERR